MKLLKQALKYDRDNYVAEYNMAFIHYKKDEYSKAVDIMQRLVNHKEKVDMFYWLLGKCYDKQGDRNKALELYNKGLSDFPYSGAIYSELGEIELNESSREKALQQFEYGIRFAPEYPDNYYHASKILMDADNIWGVIYGEIFLHMAYFDDERKEISTLLYNDFRKKQNKQGSNYIALEIPMDSAENSFEYAYSKVDMIASKESVMDTVSLYSINKIRKAFLENWIDLGYNKKFSNALFDFHKAMNEEAYFSMYNYFVYGSGSREELKGYTKGRDGSVEKFDKWYGGNYLQLHQKNPIYRGMYK